MPSVLRGTDDGHKEGGSDIGRNEGAKRSRSKKTIMTKLVFFMIPWEPSKFPLESWLLMIGATLGRNYRGLKEVVDLTGGLPESVRSVIGVESAQLRIPIREIRPLPSIWGKSTR